MKKSALVVLASCLALTSFSQGVLTTLPSGGNKKASVSERIGITDVTIHYDRPAVKGREGKIWGQLVPAGFTDPQFGTSKSSPWRAGSNENTTIEFSGPVTINGMALAAGKYGFFIAYDQSEPTIIFSRNSTSWGHYYYSEHEDALRVKIKTESLDKSVEWLQYSFNDEKENSAVIKLEWEKTAFPFTVAVNYVEDQLNAFRKELRGQTGFVWESWNQAANWCLQRNVNLEEALLWSDSATGVGFAGDRSFAAWSTKAQILSKLNRADEAAAIMKKATPYGSMNELHAYGRSLVTMKKPKEALEIFKLNAKQNPNVFTTTMGLARGYSAVGDYKTALKYATQAQSIAPDPLNKQNLEQIVQKLKEGKDIN